MKVKSTTKAVSISKDHEKDDFTAARDITQITTLLDMDENFNELDLDECITVNKLAYSR